ncbi:MAG: helix-turn-helix transcriptional regulator [Erysipelotrichaceae bacterium]
MKEFNSEKFCKDLIETRGKMSQVEFAQKIGVKRSTLSLLENGRQIPNIEILSCLCSINNKSIDEYFREIGDDVLVYFMGSLEEADRNIFNSVIEKIRIRERYKQLSERAKDVQ